VTTKILAAPPAEIDASQPRHGTKRVKYIDKERERERKREMYLQPHTSQPNLHCTPPPLLESLAAP